MTRRTTVVILVASIVLGLLAGAVMGLLDPPEPRPVSPIVLVPQEDGTGRFDGEPGAPEGGGSGGSEPAPPPVTAGRDEDDDGGGGGGESGDGSGDE